MKSIANVKEEENVGLYALQAAKHAGAKTIAIGRSEAKLKLAEAVGADVVVRATENPDALRVLVCSSKG